MGKDDKLSLIIMRDDTRVRRYRLRVAWFRFFLYLQIVLILGAVGGSYAGIVYWGQHLELVNANKDLRAQLSDQSIQLERLQNIQEILKTNDPEEIHSLFSTVTKERQSLPQVVNLQKIFVAKDLQVAGVTNLQLKKAGEDLRINFELNNLAEGTLSGEVKVYFITQEASVLEAQGEESELAFTIQRFRRVNSLLKVPSGLGLDTIFAIRVVIFGNDDEEVFTQTYPVANILTS